MEAEASARSLTLALAGRARNVAPVLAEKCPLDDARVLLDVAGGTGIYSIAWLLRHPRPARDRLGPARSPQGRRRDGSTSYGVSDRLEARPGDMFKDPMPEKADVISALQRPPRLGCRRLLGPGLALRFRAPARRPAPDPRCLPQRRPRRPLADRPLFGVAFPTSPAIRSWPLLGRTAPPITRECRPRAPTAAS